MRTTSLTVPNGKRGLSSGNSDAGDFDFLHVGDADWRRGRAGAVWRADRDRLEDVFAAGLSLCVAADDWRGRDGMEIRSEGERQSLESISAPLASS